MRDFIIPQLARNSHLWWLRVYTRPPPLEPFLRGFHPAWPQPPPKASVLLFPRALSRRWTKEAGIGMARDSTVGRFAILGPTRRQVNEQLWVARDAHSPLNSGCHRCYTTLRTSQEAVEMSRLRRYSTQSTSYPCIGVLPLNFFPATRSETVLPDWTETEWPLVFTRNMLPSVRGTAWMPGGVTAARGLSGSGVISPMDPTFSAFFSRARRAGDGRCGLAARRGSASDPLRGFKLSTSGLSDGSATHSRSRNRANDPTAYTSEFVEFNAEGSLVFNDTQNVAAGLGVCYHARQFRTLVGRPD